MHENHAKRKEIDDYIKALHDYFIEKGYIDKVSVVADEPLDHDLYKKCVNHLKEIAPKFVFSAGHKYDFTRRRV